MRGRHIGLVFPSDGIHTTDHPYRRSEGEAEMAHDMSTQGKRRSERGEGLVTGNQAVRRAIAVLKAFSDDSPEMGVTEVSRKVDLHKSTVYRLL
ncbi:MAG: helix-turn-helix domain-containing protein, partial [Acidobacteriota bacterium]